MCKVAVSQKLGEDFAKFCGLLRIYELQKYRGQQTIRCQVLALIIEKNLELETSQS